MQPNSFGGEQKGGKGKPFEKDNKLKNIPISDSDCKTLLNLEMQSSSQGKPTTIDGQATSPPFQRCATEMSGLIGSPVGLLDLSAVNQFSQQTASNMKPRQQHTSATGEQAPSMDTVKLVGVGAYNYVQPFEKAQTQTVHERVNSEAV